MATKNDKFNVSGDLQLTLETLWAEVKVTVGQPGLATVEMDGDEKLLKLIQVTGNSHQVTIKGEDSGNGGGLTVISNGRGNVVSVGGIRGGSVVIGGGGSVHIGGSFSGRNVVIVDGKVVSGGDSSLDTQSGKIPTITVKVPKGTDLEIYDVEQVKSTGLGGRVDVSLSGENEATITDAKGVKIKCSGQSQCMIENATGDLKADTSGQSGANVIGNMGDVDANTSGQSHISINGNCHDFNGDASGQSHISVSSKATGRIRQRNSGMGHISVH